MSLVLVYWHEQQIVFNLSSQLAYHDQTMQYIFSQGHARNLAENQNRALCFELHTLPLIAGMEILNREVHNLHCFVVRQ